MSQVKIQGNASGTGIFTVASPNSNTDRTLTLPDGAGTLVRDDGSGKLLKAQMPTGSVLQVVSGSSTVQQGSSATSFTETNTTATITPISTSSKILILLQANFSAEQNNVGFITVYRNGTNLASSDGLATVYLTASKPMWAGGIFVQHLDEPSSTSALTYTAYAKANAGVTWNWNWGATGTASRITLLEIAG